MYKEKEKEGEIKKIISVVVVDRLTEDSATTHPRQVRISFGVCYKIRINCIDALHVFATL